MLKAVKSKTENTNENKIRISYNNENCYKCNQKDKLKPINNTGSLSYCETCSIKVLLFEYITLEEYNELVNESSFNCRIYNFSPNVRR